MTLLKNKTTGNWEGDYRTPGVKRLHLSFRTTKKADAQTLYAAVGQLMREGDAEIIDQLRAGKITAEQVARCVRDRLPFSELRPKLRWPTVDEAADQYLAWLAGHSEREDTTAQAARTKLGRFRARFGAVTLDRVPLAEAADWQQTLVRDASANSARDAVARVVALYRWHAAEEERAAVAESRAPRRLVSPLDPKTRPTRTTKRERYLSADEATALLTATPDAYRAPIALGLYAGLRIDEMLHLRTTVDIDLGRGMLIVQARGVKGQPGYWRPKTGKRREVPITAALEAVLRHHVGTYASAAYLMPAPASLRPSVPDDERGTWPLAPNQCRIEFARIVKNAGLIYGRSDARGVVYHTLRHTFASVLVSRDINPYRVAKLLGNSLKMIEDTYGHLAPTDNRAAVALLSTALPMPEVSA